MNIKFALGLASAFLANSIYAEQDQTSYLPHPSEQIISTSASGETQIATMDQNGRWQAPETQEPTRVTQEKSTLSPNSPFPSSRCGGS